MKANSVFNHPFSEVDSVGVAISRPKRHLNQQHIGILFLDSEKTPQLLHLAWHNELRKNSPSDKYLWLDIPLDAANKVHLATICELIYETNKEGIPYGLCIEGTGFAKDGTFTQEEHHAGLTCATFVIQVFHSQHHYIIDFDGWKHRQADKKWQRQILDALKNNSDASEEHLAYQRKKIQEGAARFKPEEVAVAAAMPNPPHGGEAVKKPANQLLNQISNYSERKRGLAL